MNRLSSLDYLRGLAAFGIMVFHYSMWTFGLFSAQDFLGRVGIYDVSVFYVLSGLTLFHVYFDKIGGPSRQGLVDFAIKRIFRIFPLIWLVSLATLTYTRDPFTGWDLFLNFSGLFSFIHWDNTIAYGAWSIGNELSFYLFFPLFIFLSRKSRLLFLLFSAALLLVYLWFAFIRVNKSQNLAEFWVDYTNPLNQVFLFLGGYLIGYFFRNIMLPRALSFALITAGLLVFTFLPVSGDSLLLVKGLNRVVFTLVCVVVCFSFYKTDFGLPQFADKIFRTLGEISYSVYLVHPVMWHFLSVFYQKFGLKLPGAAQLAVGFTSSLLTAYVVYHFFEKYFMKLGKVVTKSLSVSS